MEQISNDIELEDAVTWLTQHSNFPTFDQFRKNPDKYRERPEEILESADISTRTFKNQVKRQVYMWRDQYRFKKLEELQRCIKDEGYSELELEMVPIVRPLSGSSQTGHVEIIVQFWPKIERIMMGKVVANG